jgi:hypothetical protein
MPSLPDHNNNPLLINGFKLSLLGILQSRCNHYYVPSVKPSGEFNFQFKFYTSIGIKELFPAVEKQGCVQDRRI